MSYFSGQTTDQNPADTQKQEENWLDKVVSEKGEQWKDPSVLAKGYAKSQEMITQLLQTQKEMKEDLGKQDYAKELLEAIRKEKAQPPVGEPNGDKDGATPNGTTSQTVSEDVLKGLIEQTLTQREQLNTSAQNLQTTNAKLQELYGTEVGKEVDKRAVAIGMSKDKLREIAAESPTAFFKLIGEDVKVEANPITKGSINTSAQELSSHSGKRDWQYYSKLRKENPNQYYTPKVQQQLLKDKQEQGSSFGNT